MIRTELQEEVAASLIAEGLLREDERWLAELLRPERLERLRDVLSRRTRYLTVVLEAVDDGHNQAAVLRSAEAFGVQDVTVIEGNKPFAPSKGVTQGSHKWLTLHRQPDIGTAVRTLHAAGYQVYATYLGEGAVPIDDVDLSRPTAILFGNEHSGISEEAVRLADGMFYIPMAGFVQSFNISVAAAITLHVLTRRARAIAGDRYLLSPAEKRALFLQWVLKSLRSQTRVEARQRLEAAGVRLSAEGNLVLPDEEDADA
jgi:tRNA (guanosine-2'-O-)-methyltransferase